MQVVIVASIADHEFTDRMFFFSQEYVRECFSQKASRFVVVSCPGSE